jgi:hypothetical protein
LGPISPTYVSFAEKTLGSFDTAIIRASTIGSRVVLAVFAVGIIPYRLHGANDPGVVVMSKQLTDCGIAI